MVWGTVSSAETALSHSRYGSLVLSIGCGVRFCCEGEQTGRTVNIRGVGLSGVKGGDPPVLIEGVDLGKAGSGGGLYVPIVNVGSWPCQSNSVLNA